MANDLPSIEDLLSNEDEGDSPKVRLKAKMEDIELKHREEMVKREAEEKGIPYINLMGFAMGPEALKTIPLEEAKQEKVVCFLLLEGNARFGAVNPEREEAKRVVERVGNTYHVKTDVYAISEHSLAQAIKIYEHLPKEREAVKGIDITDEELSRFTSNINNLSDFNAFLKNVSTTDLVTLLIAAGVKLRASDIHLEPRENKFIVRFRIDGVLHDITDLNDEQARLINSRLKLLSGLKLNVTNRTQDGRFTIYLPKDRIDVRASSLPTDFGETLTLRLLMASIANLKLEDLGLNAESLKVLEKQLKKPAGMIISTGPTGSGKTTTLYAIMNRLNSEEAKIITIEDPIEYRLPSISQSQVDPKRDYTFAKGLKSLVRQDPDILMVGEIRDGETTEIAIQAALTGHLLLTTLHTNDAPSAPARLLSLGAKPALLAPALNIIIGQRLVRRLCENCKKETTLSSEEKEAVEKLIATWPKEAKIKPPSPEKIKFYSAPGCDKCQNFGYWGRVGIFEFILADDDLKNAIISGNSAEHQIRELAKKEGLLTMAHDGLMKVTEGITSVEEVIKAVG